ncbi:hypothetical protein ACFE04_022441 [Oxalis oulophora]
MLSEPSQICIHFLSSRLFGERNPYIPTRFIRAHRDIIPEKIQLHSWEGRVWEVDIQKVRTGGLTQCPVQCLAYHPPSAPSPDRSPEISVLPTDRTQASPHPHHNLDKSTSDSGTFLILDGGSETDSEREEPSVEQSLAGKLRAGDEDVAAYSFSQQSSFRLASNDKKFRVLRRPKSGSIAGYNSLHIPTEFVRRNIKYLQQPSHCLLKIPYVGQIESGLTWGKRGYPDEVCINDFWTHLEKSFRVVKGVYLELLIEDTCSDDSGIVLQVMAFNANGTLCQPNVGGV